MAYKIEIELTDLEAKAWHVFIGDAQEWVENLVRGEVFRCFEQIYEQEASRMIADPSIESMPASKEAVVAQADLTSAKDRDAAYIAELNRLASGD